MTDPLASDDDWAELARELERDTPPSAPAHQLPSVNRIDPVVEAEIIAEGEPQTAADTTLNSEGEEAITADPDALGADAPLLGRKRRRRRRRRKKSPETEKLVTEQPVDESERESTDAEGACAREESTFENERDATGRIAADDDTTSEVLRDLIANWNVPSWDEIVSGLYRPS